tara:strand:+ start:597 stop:794 length:198 start_codon:yes stop_codon:yes gene_type:complete
MSEERCSQEGCGFPADTRYTWPGRDETFACIHHAETVANVAAAIGLHLQIHPLKLVPEVKIDPKI